MDDVAFVIDEREVVRANFISSNDITALGRAKKSQTDEAAEHGEKYAVLAFDAIQTCFELCGGDRVHERKIPETADQQSSAF